MSLLVNPVVCHSLGVVESITSESRLGLVVKPAEVAFNTVLQQYRLSSFMEYAVTDRLKGFPPRSRLSSFMDSSAVV